MRSEEKIIQEILQIKKDKNVTILAHYYQKLEIQNIADFLGDSLQLAQEAAKVNADIILFCGVRFMAETAKLLNPKAKVLLSNSKAGCPLADKIDGEKLKRFKEEHKNSKVVCYVNSSIETKAESDICCTSSNAERIVDSFPENQKILFVPDKNLGYYVKKRTGRDIICWDGFCNVHELLISYDDMLFARQKLPDYKIVVHPECNPRVIDSADYVASTKGIIEFVAKNDKVIIGTEIGVYERLKKLFPEKKIELLSNKAICVNMKKTSLQDIYETIMEENNIVNINENIFDKAAKSVIEMLKIC